MSDINIVAEYCGVIVIISLTVCVVTLLSGFLYKFYMLIKGGW